MFEEGQPSSPGGQDGRPSGLSTALKIKYKFFPFRLGTTNRNKTKGKKNI